jgi:hypothetical protein
MGRRVEKMCTILLIINTILFFWEWIPIGYYIHEFSKKNFNDAMWLSFHVSLLAFLELSVFALIMQKLQRQHLDSEGHQIPFRRSP